MEALRRSLVAGSPVSSREMHAALQSHGDQGAGRGPGVTLGDGELWRQFHSITNEMIVTRAGRRLFPLLRVQLSELDPSAKYCLLLEFHPTHSHRWRFLNGEWQESGDATDSQDQRCVYVHPNSPATGAQWMQESVNVAKLKLSNKENGNGRVKLNSLHKYLPCIYIVRLPSPESPCPQLQITSHSFTETHFIAVTAYQNDKITQMKIKHNPFAKAFLSSQEREEHPTGVDRERTAHLQWIQITHVPVTTHPSGIPVQGAVAIPTYDTAFPRYPQHTAVSSPLTHYPHNDTLLHSYWTSPTHRVHRNNHYTQPTTSSYVTPLGYYN